MSTGSEEIGRAHVTISARDEVTAGLANIEQRAKALDAELESIKAQFQSGYISSSQYRSGLDQVGQAKKSLQKEARQLLQELAKIDKATAGGGTGLGRYKWGILEAGRASQDFASQLQNGVGPALNGVMNNIERLITGFGGTAAAAGMVTALAVVIQVTLPWIKKLFDSMSEFQVDRFTSEIDKARTKIDEINNKTIKTEVDLRDLERAEAQLKKNIAAREKLLALEGKQSHAERESGRAIEEFLVETPGAQEAIAQAKGKYVQEHKEANPQVSEARENVKKAEADLARAEREEQVNPESHGVADVARADLERRKQELQGVQGVAADKAASEFEKIYKDAIDGVGQAQARAQRDLVAILGGKSRKSEAEKSEAEKVGDQIAVMRPSDITEGEAAEEAARLATSTGKDATAARKGRDRKARREQQETAETARTFKPGLADDIATIYAQGMIDRLDPAATMAKARAEIAKRLATAGVRGPGLDKVIDQLVGEFQKDFTGRMAGAGLGRDGVTKTMAAQTVIDRTKRAREAAAAAEKAEKEAGKEDKADAAKHARDVAASVKTFGPVYDDKLAVAMFNHGLRDATAEQSDAKLRPQLLDRLRRQTTIPADQQEAVADAMLKAARARADQQKAMFMQTQQGMFNYSRMKRDARARSKARSQAKGKAGKPPIGMPKAPPRGQGKGKPGATAMNGMPSPNAMPSPAVMPSLSAVAGMQQLQGMTAAVLSRVLSPMEAKVDMSKTEAQQDKLIQGIERSNTLLSKIADKNGYARLAPGEAVFG